MCRFIAYLGPDTNLRYVLLESDHNLMQQAWQPRELREAVLNADGFGLGWYNENGQVARYRAVIPIWNDANLPDLLGSFERPLWLAMVRSATPGLGLGIENTQPYTYSGWQFLHNGYIRNFNQGIRQQIRKEISAEIENNIRGTTDSEYLFALIMHYFENTGDISNAIQNAFAILATWLEKERALLNIVLTDGVQVVAAKHAINGESPSLYYAHNAACFDQHSYVISSECFDNDSAWKTFPDHHLMILRPGHEPTMEKIK